ncbi:MAG TPA: 50S ribosomal protein L11 methyltransferase [Syntrophales bacterium]|jgi:ribosomal protein L11 methyltransferase|nr:50S ribosomal protein L11 methyltransferase [Syntrophales bacterium]HOU77368.1 50S ribosomal protein L11 methyltransferase [Syntrophales bacterium]HPC32510.1 50S ribosomal protein L11 methyltransferase [Syntrophales bacterium]HQG34131.1 50S ribosomal protein L11 methyltransferase [Syntrophales bacterium]HQI35315.1 50S ribosomal protein L11 methyltransferase [Syntrophales bacterium]
MTKQTEKWLQIEINVPAELSDAVANFLMENGAQGVFQEQGEPQDGGGFTEDGVRETLKAYLPEDVRVENRLSAVQNYLEELRRLFPALPVPAWRTEWIADPDWGETWKKYFKPLRVTKNIIIKPTWERYSPGGHDIIIEIDPGMAFGTGQHPSTRMCLQAMEDLILGDRAAKNRRVLDVGTGTGILGIAAAKLGAGKVVCVDIDKQAVAIAGENVRMNGVEDRVDVLYRDAASLAETFDLIAANLTAKMLIKLRPRLIDLLGRGGFLVMSGIIEQNREDIEHHFFTEPFVVHRTIMEKEWLCYVLINEGYR